MKFVNIISSIVFIAIALFVIEANAATTVPVNCNWVQTSVQSGPSGAIVTMSCYDGSTIAATKIQGYGSSSGICNISPNNGYTYTGACSSPTILKYVSTTPSCGAHSGEVYGTIFVGPSAPFPSSSVASFCGSCGYSSTVLESYSSGAKLEVTCN